MFNKTNRLHYCHVLLYVPFMNFKSAISLIIFIHINKTYTNEIYYITLWPHYILFYTFELQIPN